MNQGATIKKLCKQKGITQKALAKAIGKSTTAVNQIIKGTYQATPETIKAICKEFNVPVPVFYFLGMSDEGVPPAKRHTYELFKEVCFFFLKKIYF